MAKQDANWVEIDAGELEASLKSAYDCYKLAYREMKALREAFERAMAEAAQVPVGKRMVFGYNFGKLSVAIVDDDRKPSSAKPKLSLADFMAQQQASGLRV